MVLTFCRTELGRGKLLHNVKSALRQTCVLSKAPVLIARYQRQTNIIENIVLRSHYRKKRLQFASSLMLYNEFHNCSKFSDNLFQESFVKLPLFFQNSVLNDNYGKINITNFRTILTAVSLSKPLQCSTPSRNSDFEEKSLTLSQRLVEAAPRDIKPYLQLLRIDRPIGTWLLFWPCGWSIALAAGPGNWPDVWLLSLFGLGAFVMRGAGCTINDLLDRKIDVKVQRTCNRPIASGCISPLSAFLCLNAQLNVGLLILLQLNMASVMLGASSLGLVAVYPLVKRISYWPQLVLGLTFNWGALLGWCSVHGSVALLPVIPLYIAGVFWTLIYDTIYAHQDRVDDVEAGVKSTALLFGSDTVKWLSGFSAAMIASLIVVGVSEQLAWPYYIAVGGAAANLVYQLLSLNINDPAKCGRQFRHNKHLGLLLFAGIVGGTVLAKSNDSLNNDQKGISVLNSVETCESLAM